MTLTQFSRPRLSVHTSQIALAASILWWLSTPLSAQHSDIEVDVDGGILVTIPRVAEGEFGGAPNPLNLADAPGFESPDTTFMPGEVLGFNIVPLEIFGISRHLWYWDGMGTPSFGPTPDTPADHQLIVQHPLLPNILTVTLTDAPGAAGLPGFPIATAGGTGGLHQDLEYLLVDSSQGDLLPPADGIYLFGMEMTSPSYQSSLPVYFVMASNVDEAVHEAAVDFVADLFMVPEPTSWTAIVIIGWTFCSRRRD